jgi:hypothetical protein
LPIRILLFTFDADADPDPAFHFDTDQDPDPAYLTKMIRIRNTGLKEKKTPLFFKGL